jgi:hypothetical protein
VWVRDRCRDVATGPGVVGPRGHIELRLRVGSPVLPKRRNGTGVIGPCLQTGRLPWSWTPRSGAVPIAAWGAGRVLGSCVQYGPPGWRVVAVQPGLGASRVPQRRRGVGVGHCRAGNHPPNGLSWPSHNGRASPHAPRATRAHGRSRMWPRGSTPLTPRSQRRDSDVELTERAEPCLVARTYTLTHPSSSHVPTAITNPRMGEALFGGPAHGARTNAISREEHLAWPPVWDGAS